MLSLDESDSELKMSIWSMNYSLSSIILFLTFPLSSLSDFLDIDRMQLSSYA